MPYEHQEDACARQVCWLPVDSIQPRQTGSFGWEGSASLEELAESIRRDGLVRPVTVQRTSGGRYTVVSGNRRLLACRMAGLTHIDAVVLESPAADAPAQQLLERLLSGRLHYLEEAQTLHRLHTVFGMHRDALARSLGRTPDAVARRMRLMELDEPLRAFLMEENLSEGCARALLRLPDRHVRMMLARQAASQRLSVRDVELLVTSALTRLPVPPPSGGKTIVLMRDHRLYLNAIRAIIAQMQEAGMAASCDERAVGDGVEVTLRLPIRRRRSAVYHTR